MPLQQSTPAASIAIPAILFQYQAQPQAMINQKIALRGVHIPVQKEIYTPVLKELEAYGVVFIEKTVEI